MNNKNMNKKIKLRDIKKKGMNDKNDCGCSGVSILEKWCFCR